MRQASSNYNFFYAGYGITFPDVVFSGMHFNHSYNNMKFKPLTEKIIKSDHSIITKNNENRYRFKSKFCDSVIKFNRESGLVTIKNRLSNKRYSESKDSMFFRSHSFIDAFDSLFYSVLFGSKTICRNITTLNSGGTVIYYNSDFCKLIKPNYEFVSARKYDEKEFAANIITLSHNGYNEEYIIEGSEGDGRMLPFVEGFEYNKLLFDGHNNLSKKISEYVQLAVGGTNV